MSTGPDFLGHYRILRTLGEGGMGIVYEAEQDQPHRRVALKVIRPDFVTPEMSRRFSRESEVLGRLQHPGIAQIYEAGTAESPWGPQSYFAMELVDGIPLTDFAASRTLDVRRRLELFGKVCEAVHYAHQKGVIHRDLKPANIIVEASGQPKILDFGVARVTDADVGTRQTSVGEVVGTLQYMSPEQIGADPLDLDTRSDVYSLGVILYEVLTGRLPYDLTRRLIHEAARIIMFDDPVPLSSVARQLKGDVEVIVAKALEKDKARRYGSADEMASDIRRYLRDEPISARPASAFYQMRKFTRRHRSIVAGVAAAMVMLVAGAAVSTWQAVRARAAERLSESRRVEATAATLLAERRRATADSLLQIADSARALALREQEAATASAARATSEAEKASAVNSFMQDMLASSDPSRARGADLSVREVLEQAATASRRNNAGRPPAVRAAIEATIGRTYQSLGLYEKARPHLDSANALHRIAGSPARERAAGIRDLGGLSISTGDFATAERQLSEALSVMRSAHAADDDHVTEVMAQLAHVRYSRSRNAEAEALYRDALRLARARHGNAGATVASRLQSLGTFLTWTGRFEDGVPILTEALVLQRKAVGDLHPDVIGNMVGLADAQRNVRDFKASEATMRDALPMARRIFGDQHPTLANVLQR
ncbi:MAG: serine/threonine protein kinase, partial [Cytophagaceae bacterium]|nr:serine/threonine protein kinase [Gemmatimonadaceae bacterium]